jgi:CMP-N-acetylneuraminic acid synthetase
MGCVDRGLLVLSQFDSEGTGCTFEGAVESQGKILEGVSMEVLAVIPARGGSKGIRRKNLVEVGGYSLVARSIRHALRSNRVGRVIVSTEDEEIRRVSMDAGAEVPFLRPEELAGDNVLDCPVFEHVLRKLMDTEGYRPDLVVHLRPTAPYRQGRWIDEAVDKLASSPKADSIRSVSEPQQHPYRMFNIDSNGYLEALMKHEHPQPFLLRRQDLPRVYYYNCVIDVTRPATVLDGGSMTGNRILPYVMNPQDVMDIDSERDLEIARLLIGTEP